MEEFLAGSSYRAAHNEGEESSVTERKPHASAGSRHPGR
jgi:hypothetical protein